MKFLIVSEKGEGAALSKRLLDEGNEVYLYIVDQNYSYIFNGLVNKVSNIIQAASQKPDICIFTSNRLSKEYQYLQSQNLAIFGGSSLQYKLEFDKEFADRFASAWGIRISKDKINGIKLNTEIWFVDGEPIYQYNTGIEQDRFLTGDLGSNSCCQSYVLYPHFTRNSLVVERLFNNSLYTVMKKIKYNGPFNVQYILNEKDDYPYFLRFIPRFNYPAIYTMLEIMNGEFGKLINDIIKNQKPTIDLKSEYSCSLTISMPPYPYSFIDSNLRSANFNLKIIDDFKYIWLCDIFKNSQCLISGKSGLVMYITGSDQDWKKARIKTKKILDNMDIQDLQYRIDAGIQGEKLEKLKEKRYI